MQAGNVSQLFVSFQGEGLHAGRRQLFVRFGGCPLRCRYCDEPESLVPVAACRILGPDGERERPNPFTGAEIEAEIAGLVDAAPPLHAMAVTGGEPPLPLRGRVRAGAFPLSALEEPRHHHMVPLPAFLAARGHDLPDLDRQLLQKRRNQLAARQRYPLEPHQPGRMRVRKRDHESLHGYTGLPADHVE